MIKLDGVQETMLIPLVIKASETKRKNPRIQDEMAVKIVDGLSMDSAKFDKFMSHEGVIARTIMLDTAMKQYIKSFPDAVCICLGCGLDNRFSRVDNGRILWYDLDFPDVIAIRKQFFQNNERVHMIADSALNPTWPAMVEKREKTIFIMEGMLMYFKEEEVQELFHIIKENFKDVIILAELMHPLPAKNGGRHHDTIKHTNAAFRWGIRSGKELEAICPGVQWRGEKSLNCEMRKHSVRGRLFATIPWIKNFNDRIAVYTL